ncbi:SGNH/GDSL hydrolase family protein [Pseudoduganella sp. R-32]|uniref:SGNH/GDSL hydrolase family protein n=1 Tax=Pseudoduganella sp. R-32 TaxID=3404061 RepID=UPI003CEA842B
MSNERIQWLLKVLQPEKALASLPGIAALTEDSLAALIGIDPELYRSELNTMRQNAKEAAAALLDEPGMAKLVDQLPLRKGAQIIVFGDSLTADPQAWAVILAEMLAACRPNDALTVMISAVPGETTAHGLVRLGESLVGQPDWLIFFMGTNDARTQGPKPTKTIVSHEETARNLVEMRSRAIGECKAQRLWITPPAVNEEQVAAHWGLSRFGVRLRNEDVAQVAKHVRILGDPVIDLFSALGALPAPEMLMDDGLHLSLEGQKRIAREVVRGWSVL